MVREGSPAVKYAADGYPCAPNLSYDWKRAFQKFRKELKDPCFDALFRTFAPGGRVYEAGDLVCLPDHAATLEEIGRTNADSFYKGRIARKIEEESIKYGGKLR